MPLLWRVKGHPCTWIKAYIFLSLRKVLGTTTVSPPVLLAAVLTYVSQFR